MKGFNSKLIHGKLDNHSDENFRSLKTPIYDTASYDFKNAEELEDAFHGRGNHFAYSRTANPTVAELQNRLKTMSNAEHCLCVSSGMFAISSVILSLCDSGDNILASKYLFGNTYSLFIKTFKSFGIETRFVDFENLEEVQSHIDSNTRAIFMEIMTNPQLIVYDFEQVAQLATQKNIPLIADNTVLTSYGFPCHQYDIDIEVISTSKFVSGGATSIGGAVFVHKNTKWEHVPKLKNEFQNFGEDAFIKKITPEIFRNMGGCMAPNNAYLKLLGLETLSLRIDKICDNALKAAQFLQNHPKVKGISYNLLDNSPYNKRTKKYFKENIGGCLIKLELENKQQAFNFSNALQMIRRGTNFCDNKSMIIHPASTIYCDYSDEERQEMQIYDGTLRLAIGLEDFSDIQEDLEQALDIL
ncbi:methionine gamma-lyase [Flavobacteriaceae bacterium UJ101]|nr:methionine gamma-lyase [Flavobacteriaceae bacterium UJ101]